MNSSTHTPNKATAGDLPSLPPPLPIELAESVLLHVPLRFPLQSLAGDDKVIHDTCAAAFVTLRELPTSYLPVFIPRLLNGAAKLCADPGLFDADLIHRLYLAGFTLKRRDIFMAMLKHNRVDLLDWWAYNAKLDAPLDSATWGRDTLSQYALSHKSWAALAWIARTAFLRCVDIGLYEEQLCELVADGGEEQVKMAEIWLRSSIGVFDGMEAVAVPACATACFPILEAMRECRSEYLYGCEGSIVNYCVEAAVQNGHTHVLEWMVRKAGWYLENVVEWACEYERMDVLEWFKENKEWVDPEDAWVGQVEYVDGSDEPKYPPEGKPDDFAMDAACMNGKLKVLDWLVDNASVVPLLYTRAAIESACANGNLDVLKWWKTRGTAAGLPPRYTDSALCSATLHGHMHVLEWWFMESGWELRCDLNDLFRHAFRAPDFEAVVDWWIFESGLAIDFATQCAGVVSKCDWATWPDRTLDNLAVLDNWTRSKHKHLFPCNVSDALCNAARAGQVHVLDWWKSKSGISLEFDHWLMDVATAGIDAESNSYSGSDRMGTIKWVYELHAEHGIEVQYSEAALDGIQWALPFHECANVVKMAVLKWWLTSGLELKYSDKAFVNAVLLLSKDDADWWVRESGLPVRYTADGFRHVFELRQVYPEAVERLVKLMVANGLDLKLTADECRRGDGEFVVPVLEEYFAKLSVSD